MATPPSQTLLKLDMFHDIDEYDNARLIYCLQPNLFAQWTKP